MTDVELQKLEAGERLDCLVHELIYGPRGPETEIAPFSSMPWAMGPVMKWLSENARYFGLMSSYDGLWVAMAGDGVDCFARFDSERPFFPYGDDRAKTYEDESEDEDCPVRFLADTPMTDRMHHSIPVYSAHVVADNGP
jgi:hypothetical protein